MSVLVPMLPSQVNKGTLIKEDKKRLRILEITPAEGCPNYYHVAMDNGQHWCWWAETPFWVYVETGE